MNTIAFRNTVEDPEIQKALDSVKLPEVQEIVRKLSEFGLAVALPHAHAENGHFIPLPSDKISHENGLSVSFLAKDNPELNQAVPVMWRWDKGIQASATCASCDYAAAQHT